MIKISQPPLSLWQFESFGRQPGIRHFVSDRNSNPSGKEFTLSLSSLPDKEVIRENRRLLAQAMGVGDDKLFFPSQVHLTKIVNVTARTTKEEIMDTDALISNEPGICIAVMSADCVPVLLYDKKNHAVAAVHSGWKGTVARILEKTLNAMQKQFGTKGSDL